MAYQWPYSVAYGLNVDGYREFHGPTAKQEAMEFAQQVADETGWTAFVRRGTKRAGAMAGKSRAKKVRPRRNPEAELQDGDWIPCHAIRKMPDGSIQLLTEKGSMSNPAKKKRFLKKVRRLFSR